MNSSSTVEMAMTLGSLKHMATYHQTETNLSMAWVKLGTMSSSGHIKQKVNPYMVVMVMTRSTVVTEQKHNSSKVMPATITLKAVIT